MCYPLFSFPCIPQTQQRFAFKSRMSSDIIVIKLVSSENYYAFSKLFEGFRRFRLTDRKVARRIIPNDMAIMGRACRDSLVTV